MAKVTDQKIRVAIVDDSVFFRSYLSRALLEDGSFEVVAAFGDPIEAQEALVGLPVDVVTVDMEMPGMRGPDFLRAILPRFPGVNAVVISAIGSNVFEALHAGAIDFVSKPNSRPGYTREEFCSDIIAKIQIAASVAPRRPTPVPREGTAPSTRPSLPSQPTFRIGGRLHSSPRSVIAIGASTGGTEAILSVIKAFPRDIPGVVMVQHMPPVFTEMYAQRLDRSCAISVREAKHGDRVEQGLALLAPGDKQMQLVQDAKGYYVSCYQGEKVSGHCPSVDVLFHSVAATAKGDAVGIILTGMGSDGAKGLLDMRRSGAYTFGQNQESSVVYGMPLAAYNLGGVCQQLAVDQIGEAVIARFRDSSGLNK